MARKVVSKKSGLTQIAASLIQNAEGNKIEIGQILGVLKHRGFGPLLMAPTILIILPSGAIPGLPAICGIFIFLISIQILIGKSQPWLPVRLKHISYDKEKFKYAFEKTRPWMEAVDSYVQNRLEFLTESEISKRFVSLISVLISLGIIFTGFIPMMPAVLALPVLFFALSLIVHDGVLMAIGYIVFMATSVGLYFY